MSLFERRAQAGRRSGAGPSPAPLPVTPPAGTPNPADPALDTDLVRALRALQSLEDTPEPVRWIGRPNPISSPLRPRVR